MFWNESQDICCSFKKKPDGDTATDMNNALSDNAKVKQLRVSRDGTFYPRDRLEIDCGKNDFSEAYKSYQKVCESNGNKEPILDMTAFKSLLLMQCSTCIFYRKFQIPMARLRNEY